MAATLNASDVSPRIYVASLTDYNAGILHGAWVDATMHPDAIMDEVGAMLEGSPTAKAEGTKAEEWAIHDYEGFEGIKLSEHESFEDVATLAELIENHGRAFVVWYENETREVGPKLEEEFLEAYQGTFKSAGDYMEQLSEETGMLGNIPMAVLPYIDWEAMARDAGYNGDFWSHEEGYHETFIYRNS